KRLDGWKKAVAEGHEIGNHSNTHPCTANYSFSRLNALENYTLEMMAAQLDGANAEIETLLGVKPRTFAYPCGQKFVGRGLDTRSYVPLVADRFLVGRGAVAECDNDPERSDAHRGTANYSFSQLNALENYTLEMMAAQLDGAKAEIETLLGVKARPFAYPCGQKFVGRGLDTRSYVPLVADRFLVGRGYLDESANDPE